MDLNFDTIIDDYVRLKQEKEKKELIVGKYSASMLGSCTRQIYYAYNYPKEFDNEKLKIFELGNIIHDWVATLLANSSHTELIANEKEIAIIDAESDCMISGRMDDMITIIKNGQKITTEKDGMRLKNTTEKIIVEVKSIRSLAYLDRPKEPHVLQLTIYLKAMAPYGVKQGVLLYVDKNNLKTKAFPITYNHATFLKALGRARAIHAYLTSTTLPPAEAKQTLSMKWSCAYCEYADQCKADEKK